MREFALIAFQTRRLIWLPMTLLAVLHFACEPTTSLTKNAAKKMMGVRESMTVESGDWDLVTASATGNEKKKTSKGSFFLQGGRRSGSFLSSIDCQEAKFEAAGMTFSVQAWLNGESLNDEPTQLEPGCSAIDAVMENVPADEEQVFFFRIYGQVDDREPQCFKQCSHKFILSSDSEEGEIIKGEPTCRLCRKNGVSGTMGLAEDGMSCEDDAALVAKRVTENVTADVLGSSSPEPVNRTLDPAGFAAFSRQADTTLDTWTLEHPDTGVTVSVVDVLHVGPKGFFQALNEFSARQADDNGDTAVLSEGTLCSKSNPNIQKIANQMEVPSYEEVVAKFGDEKAESAVTGKMTEDVADYLVGEVSSWIKKNSPEKLFEHSPCNPPPQASNEKRKNVNDGHNSTTDAVNEEDADQQWVFQMGQDSPYRDMIEGLVPGVTLYQADGDVSDLDINNPEHLAWLFFGQSDLELTQNPNIGEEESYMLQSLGLYINRTGWRNQEVIYDLKRGIDIGLDSFVIPWGAAHNDDFIERLETEGYVIKSREKLPYARCNNSQPGGAKERLCNVATSIR